MSKYEAHITMPKTDDVVNKVSDGVSGWQYSCIDDDPIMGQKPYCYLTGYHTSEYTLADRMRVLCAVLEKEGVPVLRTKIERIIFDSKTGGQRTQRSCARSRPSGGGCDVARS